MDMIEKDLNGRIIHEKRDDGFEEFIDYYDDGDIKRVETHYPKGQIEIENFVKSKDISLRLFF